jgi:hypothetical protein
MIVMSMRRENQHRTVLYRCILGLRRRVLKLGWGKTACGRPRTLPTQATTLDVRTDTYSVRSVPTEQHQQTLLIHDVFLLLVGSTKSSFSSSSTSSRCLCAHGEVSSLHAFAWAAWRSGGESAPSIRAQLLVYYTKLLLRGQRSRLSNPQPAGRLGLQAAQAQLCKGCRRCMRCRRHSCRAELCRTSSATATEA